MTKIVGIVLAGGSGKRLKSHVAKQYMSLNGKLVVQYSIDAFYNSGLFDEIILVTNQKYQEEAAKLKYVNKVVFGGKTRSESVWNGLLACRDTEYVVFHDAVRPFIKAKDLAQYVEALKENDCVITAKPITDALYGGDRTDFKLIQTPEAFKYAKLVGTWKKTECIAIYEHLTSPYSQKMIELPYENLKITNPQDFFMAEQLLKYREPVIVSPSWNGYQVLLLGGTGGIGRAVAKHLTKNGATVTICGSKDFDLGNPYSYENPYPLLLKKWDSIIHCAGAYATDKEGLNSQYEKIMNVNFRSAVYLAENATRLIQKGGSLIFIGSTAAAYGRKNIAIYSASKAALNNFTEAVAPQLAEQQIYMNVICPAKVNTPLQTHINPKANKNQMIQPDDLAMIIGSYVNTTKFGEIIYIRVGQEKL